MKSSATRLPALTVFLATLLQFVLAGSARATDFCEDMHHLVAQARSNFIAGSDQLDNTSGLEKLSEATNCSMARAQSGANSFHCAWEFPFRDAAAKEKFNKLDSELRLCFDSLTESEKDQGVNHPDSYDLRQYNLGEVSITASLKDKSALQRTYVFIGLQGVVLD